MCRFGRHISVTFFAGCATLSPVKIRARKNPSGVTVYQLDLGLIDGRRVRQTFKNKADAQSALVRARAKVASEGINALIPPAPEHPNLAKWMLRLEGTGKTLDDVFRCVTGHFKMYHPRSNQNVPPRDVGFLDLAGYPWQGRRGFF